MGLRIYKIVKGLGAASSRMQDWFHGFGASGLVASFLAGLTIKVSGSPNRFTPSPRPYNI